MVLVLTRKDENVQAELVRSIGVGLEVWRVVKAQATLREERAGFCGKRNWYV